MRTEGTVQVNLGGNSSVRDNVRILKVKTKPKKSSKQDQLIDLMTRLTEQVGLMQDSARSDRGILTYTSQELSILKSKVSYMEEKQKIATKNPLIVYSDKLFKLLSKLPIDLILAVLVGATGTLLLERLIK